MQASSLVDVACAGGSIEALVLSFVAPVAGTQLSRAINATRPIAGALGRESAEVAGVPLSAVRGALRVGDDLKRFGHQVAMLGVRSVGDLEDVPARG